MRKSLCLVALLAVGCDDNTSGPVAPTAPAVGGFTLRGVVSDSRENAPALAGATVRATPGTIAQTDPEGRYAIPNLSGEVTVHVGATHYRAASTTVTMDEDRVVDFELDHTGTPPYSGTAFISPDVIDGNDPSVLMSVAYTGRGERAIYDGRVDTVIRVNAYLFDVRYTWGAMEFQVNPEFGSREASRAEVDTFASPLGRLPVAMMTNAQVVEVNAGNERFSGGSGTFTVHTGNGHGLIRDGYLEEVLFHEASHVTLDHMHSGTPSWTATQEADGVFISTYAQEQPQGEDVAETIVAWFALRYRADRIGAADQAAIKYAIPNRLRYFDEAGIDMSPYTRREAPPVLGEAWVRPGGWRVFERPRILRGR